MAFSHLKKQFDFHPYVFIPSVILIFSFIILTISFRENAEEIFDSLKEVITTYTGWFFVLAVNTYLIFCLFIAFSAYGNLRIGGLKAKPEFSTSSWFAMLFSAGMGIGILFYSVYEPIQHFADSPLQPDKTIVAAKASMGLAFLHYGLHAWAIYAVVGLSLSYFAFSLKLPLSIRSVFYPIFGDAIHGTIGNIIDTVAVLSTLFGLATSLGFGATQVNAGLEFVYGWTASDNRAIWIIIVITSFATVSVVLGLDKGVRFLSIVNIRIAALFLIAMIILGPTLFILDSWVQNLGYYIQHFVKLGFWTEAYQSSNWQNDWTVFYWAWWIAWSPFVGIFIARVSRGRTVREFVLGVLVVPALLTFVWITAFGGSAIYLELEPEGGAGIVKEVLANPATALFAMLDHFPMAWLTSLIGIVLVVSFFVTSSDSGSLVIDSLTAGGKLDAPVGQRIFWAVTEGLVAAILLWGGGLKALQTAVITTGLPFAIILLLMCFSLVKALDRDLADQEAILADRTPLGKDKADEDEEKNLLYNSKKVSS